MATTFSLPHTCFLMPPTPYQPTRVLTGSYSPPVPATRMSLLFPS